MLHIKFEKLKPKRLIISIQQKSKAHYIGLMIAKDKWKLWVVRNTKSWSKSRANVAPGAATEVLMVLMVLMQKVSQRFLYNANEQRKRKNDRRKARTKTEEDIPSIMMFAAVKSSGSQNLGWTHLSPLWSNSRANVASGAATEVLVICLHLLDPELARACSQTNDSLSKKLPETYHLYILLLRNRAKKRTPVIRPSSHISLARDRSVGYSGLQG